MYTTADYTFSQTTALAARPGLALYNAALARGWLKRLWAVLSGQKCTLRQLPANTNPDTADSRIRHTVREIAVRDIIGSEDRRGDFDLDFNPLREATRDRWLSVYHAWVSGISLPPIELVRGPDGYYVRDGHHRLSVARAVVIDATLAQVGAAGAA